MKRASTDERKEKKGKEKKRFFVDYSKDPKMQHLVLKLLEEANQKSHGNEVTFKDLVSYCLNKIGKKDLEKIKTLALGEMDKVQILLEKHNQKHGASLGLGEFLVKQLKI